MSDSSASNGWRIAWSPTWGRLENGQGTSEEDVQPSHVNKAQKVASRMAQMVLRCPRVVVKMDDQIWRYLKTTRNEGLSFHPARGTGWAGEWFGGFL